MLVLVTVAPLIGIGAGTIRAELQYRRVWVVGIAARVLILVAVAAMHRVRAGAVRAGL